VRGREMPLASMEGSDLPSVKVWEWESDRQRGESEMEFSWNTLRNAFQLASSIESEQLLHAPQAVNWR